MRGLALVATVLAVLIPRAGLAGSYEYLGGAHWRLPSEQAEGARRTLLVVDATGDPRAQRALHDFKGRWNAMREAPGLDRLPAVEIAVRAPYPGCAAPRWAEVVDGAGDVIVCRDDGLDSAGVGGPYWVDGQNHIRLGVVKLRGATLAWSACSLRTAVAHEMGHVMGLGHNDRESPGAPSVMMSGGGPYRRGCPTWFNDRDQRALRALYDAHRPAAGPTQADGGPASAGRAPATVGGGEDGRHQTRRP